MRLLANENIPGNVVRALQRRGHDVVWVRRETPGSTDAQVLERAASEKRILLMLDKDFGELAFRSGLPASAGIVLFRLVPTSPSKIARLAASILESRQDWSGHFTVIEEDRVRMTPLPRTGESEP